jgi:hypothetical protein
VPRRSPKAPPPPSPGLDRVEVVLFVFGVVAFAVLMVAFAQPLNASDYLPLVVAWIVAGVTFVWWFHRFLSRH